MRDLVRPFPWSPVEAALGTLRGGKGQEEDPEVAAALADRKAWMETLYGEGGYHFPSIEHVLAAHNQASSVYFTPGVFARDVRPEGGKHSAKTDANVLLVPAVWADVDGQDQDGATEGERLAKALAKVQGSPLPPSWVVCSGRGYQAYWLLDQALELQKDGKADRAAHTTLKALLDAIADTVGGDRAVAHAASYLRVPGSLHFRDGVVRLGGVVEGHTDRRYGLADVAKAFGVDLDSLRRKVAPEASLAGTKEEAAPVRPGHFDLLPQCEALKNVNELPRNDWRLAVATSIAQHAVTVGDQAATNLFDQVNRSDPKRYQPGESEHVMEEAITAVRDSDQIPLLCENMEWTCPLLKTCQERGVKSIAFFGDGLAAEQIKNDLEDESKRNAWQTSPQPLYNEIKALPGWMQPNLVYKASDWLGVPARDIWTAIGHPQDEKANKQEPPYTDLGNAERLLYDHGANLRYEVFRGSHDNLGWLQWDGTRWAEDERYALVYGMFKAAIRTRRERAEKTIARLKKLPPQVLKLVHNLKRLEQATALRDWCLRSEAKNKIDAALSLAQHEQGVPVVAVDLDQNGWLMNVANGTIDLKTGELGAHQRGDLITKLAPVTFDPKATCPKWSGFLDEIMGGDQELVSFLQRLVGYALTGVVHQHVLPIFYGLGANGKGTFIKVIQGLLGDYAGQMPAESLMQQGKDGTSGATPNEPLAQLRGQRLAVASEPEEGRRLAEALVKLATGGDRMTARFLYGHQVTWEPTHKLILLTNHKPVVRGTDDGIWRRLRLVPFEHQIPEAQRINDYHSILLAEEASGILNWALEGCAKWQKEGLTAPKAVEDATAEYREEMDRVQPFLDACCKVGNIEKIDQAQLYTAYAEWFKANGYGTFPANGAFYTTLRKKGFDQKQSHGRRFFLGLSLQKNWSMRITGMGMGAVADTF